MPSRTAVGIVLDAGVLQAVELTAEGGRLAIRRAICEKLPATAFTEGELTDATAVAEAVRQVFRSHKLPRRNVSVAFGGRLALARVIEVAETSTAEAESILQDRIARYAIYDNLEVLWKAVPIETDDEQKRVYLVASAAQAQVSALLPALRRAGVHVSRLEPYAMAMIRAMAGCLGEDERPTVLVSVRSESTDFVIVKGRTPLLVRSIEEGMSDLARQPQAADDLLVETKRSLEFCKARFADARPRVWLCQGASENADAAIAFMERLKQEVQDADVEPVPAWPDVITAAGARQVWGAVGTAMVELVGHEVIPHLNLVPPEWPEIERVQKQLVQAVASIGVAILLTVGIAAVIRVATDGTAKMAAAASNQMAANTADVTKASDMKQKAVAALAQVNLWKEVRAEVEPFDWAAGMDTVMAQVPEGIRVQQLTFRKGVLRLSGEAKSTDLVHQLVQKLSRLPDLEEASIERLVQAPGTGNRLPGYAIICRFREPVRPLPQEAKKP